MEDIYEHEINQWANDSRRSLLSYHKRKYAWLNTMRNTTTQFTIALAIGISLLSVKSLYA